MNHRRRLARVEEAARGITRDEAARSVPKSAEDPRLVQRWLAIVSEWMREPDRPTPALDAEALAEHGIHKEAWLGFVRGIEAAGGWEACGHKCASIAANTGARQE